MATSAAVVARGLLVALLMAAAASVDAMEVPDKWYFGGGMEDKDSGGMEVTVKKNGKVVVKPKMKPRSMRIKKFTTFVKPKGGAQARGATTPASTFTVALKAGSRTDDPAGAYYTVTWTNYAPGTFKFATDRIAVLIGDQSGNLKTNLHPVKYVFVDQAAPSTYAQGSGSTDIWLPFLRSPVTFAYITESNLNGIWNGFNAVGPPVVIQPYTAKPVPHNVKLTYVSKGSTITTRAVWQTVPTGATTVNMTARFGTSRGAYPNTTSARVDTYTGGDMCDQPAQERGFMTPGLIWVADMTKLLPGTKYYYQVGDQASNTWSAEASFVTPPADAVADPNTEARILLTADAGQYAPDNAYMPDGNTFGITSTFAKSNIETPGQPAYCGLKAMLADLGSGPGQQPATKEVYAALTKAVADASGQGKDYHAYFVNGDIAYARGESHQWDTWQWATAPILTRVPGVYTPGNHEADDIIGFKTYPDAADFAVSKTPIADGGGECNVPYRKLLQPPQPSGATSDWYSVTIGPMHVIQLNSEQTMTPGTFPFPNSDQYTWLVNELNSVDRAKTPWLIVSLHRPLYVDTVQAGDQNAAEIMRNAIEPLLVAAQVDMVWAGHIHAYQRSCLGGVVKGKCVPQTQGGSKGFVNVLTGNAGFQAPIDLFSTVPEWEVGGKQTYAYGYSEVVATKTQLTFKSYLSKGALNGVAPTLFDSFVLTKPAGWMPNLADAKNLYSSTTPGNILPSPVINMTPWFADVVKAYGANSDDNDVQSTWFQTNCLPGQKLYELVTPSPSKVTQWPIQDVWYASNAFLNFLNTYVGNSTVAPMNDLRTNNAAALTYFTNLLKPGGRGYFGP